MKARLDRTDRCTCPWTRPAKIANSTANLSLDILACGLVLRPTTSWLSVSALRKSARLHPLSLAYLIEGLEVKLREYFG